MSGHETAVDGGDLAISPMSVADIESFTRAMPLRRPLSDRDVHAVAAFVHTRAGRR